MHMQSSNSFLDKKAPLTSMHLTLLFFDINCILLEYLSCHQYILHMSLSHFNTRSPKFVEMARLCRLV